MWLGKRGRPGPVRRDTSVGTVTLPGAPAGVFLDGERRNVTVYAPGGYHWVPRLGDQALVLKREDARCCAVGTPVEQGDLEPGEVLITAGKSAIRLGLDGTVNVTGTLRVNGMPVMLGSEG